MSEENVENTIDFLTEPVVEKVEEPQVIVEAPVEEKTGKGLGEVVNGTIGSVDVKSKPKKEKVVTEVHHEETVAIKSNRNISWSGVGSVKTGINIVTKSEADKWLTMKGIELASPNDVAKGSKA